MDVFPGLSGNLFAGFIYDTEVEDVGIGVVARVTVDVTLTGYVTAMSFNSILLTSAGLAYLRMTATFFSTGSFVGYILFEAVFWMHNYGF